MKLAFLTSDVLVCPDCTRKGKDDRLKPFYEPSEVENDEVKNGLLTCGSCSQAYPIRDGIAIFPGGQDAQKYGSKEVAQTYILTQYRDIIAAQLRTDLTEAGSDLTGYYAEAEQENYYARLTGLLETHINKESRLIDIGCAVGRLSRMLAPRAGLVIGVDISLAEVKVARQLLLTGKAMVHLGFPNCSGAAPTSEGFDLQLEEPHQPNVEFIVADANLLPFRDGSFDVVCASSVIDRVPDAQQFIQNVNRVAKDGARVLLTSPFDFSEKYTPKVKWLGRGAFNTPEGPAENALEKLLQKHQCRIENAVNLRWTHYSDRRHHSVWNVYAGVFEAWRYRIEVLNPKAVAPDSLIKSYKRVFAEDRAFQDAPPDDHEVAERFRKIDLLIVAKRTADNQVIGFAGGQTMKLNRLEDDSNKIGTYDLLNDLGGDRIFRINELGVLKEYQGAGVATQLLNALLGHARANGHHTYTLVTAYESHAALSLYKRHGFSILTNQDGVRRKLCDYLRVGNERRADLRPRLYRVDEFTKGTLRNGRDVHLEVIRPHSLQKQYLLPLANRISELFGRAFWHSDDPDYRWPLENVMDRMAHTALVLLVFDEERQPIAYSMFQGMRWRDRDVLYLGSIGVSAGTPEFPENWQNTGLGVEMFREALTQMPSDTLVARSQNPAIASLLRTVRPNADPSVNQAQQPRHSQVLPIDAPYSDEDIEMIRGIAAEVPQLKKADVDFNTGILRATYPEGRLGYYDSRLNQELLSQFETIMKRLDESWDYHRGDAVLLIATGLCSADRK